MMTSENRVPINQPVVMYQNWEELLFLHWSFEPELIQQVLPPGLLVDTFNERAWVGVVPFFMSGVRPRFLPSIPGVSNFQELNLRTYVVDEQGRRGVWFYSLDTSDRLPVWIARRFFHLNYVYARMTAVRSDQQIAYKSTRSTSGGAVVEQGFVWQRKGAATLAEVGSLEYFLVERYRLYSFDVKRQQLFTGLVAHEPYQIQCVELGEYSTRLFALNGFDEPACAPESVIASRGAKVRIYPLSRV
ncbi:MAG: YqjF family protein [Lentimonas sp.]